jgi:hypothetical protein
MFTQETIQARLDRAAAYFPDPELRRVITAGVSDKTARELTNLDAHTGLEEGVWSYHLLRYVTNQTVDSAKQSMLLSNYIASVKTLQTRSQFFWSVDGPGNPWAPIWVRLVDRLRHTVHSDDQIKSRLSPEAALAINEVYMSFKEAVDERRAKHAKIDAEFAQIFQDAKYREVSECVRQPVTREVTPKHCAKMLFEIQNPEKRLSLIRAYFEALNAHREVPLTAQLVKKYRENMTHFSADYTGILPRDVVEVSEASLRCFESFS